ncbi:MAG: hypothetical protein UH541_09905 [Prevotella sp.]|nr:hypothetical protein [Prevotella sp.]
MRKKLQQQNNEAAQKRFTTFIALLVVLLFVIGGSLQVQAQVTNTNGTPIAGIESLTGCSEDQVRAANINDYTFPEDDKSKIFFLYNVKTGLLLNAGGYWGTHVSLKEYGMPLWIHIDSEGWIHLAQKFDSKESKEEGNYLEYETGNNKHSEDNGVYIDRAYIYKLTGTLKNIVKRGWELEAVYGKTHTYRLYTYSNTSKAPNTIPIFGKTKYYLIAAKTQGDVDKNCYAVEAGSADIAKGNDEWRFLSYQQILDLQDKNTDNIISSIDLTFRLQCPGFSRENAAMHNWKAYQYGGSGQIRLGLEHYYKPFVKNDKETTFGYCTIDKAYTNDFEENIESYTFPEGSNAITFKKNDNYERHCGKYYCADAKKFRGTIYQDVKVSHGGTYVIECKGFSTTTKAKLYACLVNDNKPDTKTMHATILGQTNYMSAQEKKALHIEEQNMDYAAKEFYGSHKYFNSVLVQVPEKGGTIRFGIEIGTQADTKPEESEWTVFDDFRLLYTSRTTDGDLVLDQDRDNLNYLKDCSNTYKSVTLHLNKTFDKDKWNGFVLPVSLTKDQLTQAFGPNVKLAKLDKLTSNEIQFVSIDMSKAGNETTVMEAYVPYIIFPTKHAEQEQTPAYTALLSKIVNGQAKDERVIIGKNHIDIPNVTFAVDGENKNNLTNMNTTNRTTNSSIVVDGSGTPFVSGNGTMTAFGTFARTFGKGTQYTKDDDNYGKWTITEKETIIKDRSDLKGCYFFSNGKMYFSDIRTRGLRGFSVWFAPTTASGNPAKSANVFLDGVSLDKTTGINPIIYGEEESRIDRFAHGIYSLNGQLISNSSSLDGLPSGIYILNGKKVIKR